MSFFKIFLMNVFCFNLVIAHQSNKPDCCLKTFFSQSMIASAAVGASTGVVDYYIMGSLGFPFPLFMITAGELMRRFIINKAYIYDKLENCERDNNQKQKALNVGALVSCGSWALTYYCCSRK